MRFGVIVIEAWRNRLPVACRQEAITRVGQEQVIAGAQVRAEWLLRRSSKPVTRWRSCGTSWYTLGFFALPRCELRNSHSTALCDGDTVVDHLDELVNSKSVAQASHPRQQASMNHGLVECERRSMITII